MMTRKTRFDGRNSSGAVVVSLLSLLAVACGTSDVDVARSDGRLGAEQPSDETRPTQFVLRLENVGPVNAHVSSGTFAKPTPGPIGPGESFTFEVRARKGQRLSLATMFAQSNDWFYGPDEEGIPLFDEAGMPRSGDVTSYLHLWDAGTEMDEVPGIGAHQAPRQPSPDTGKRDPDTRVRKVSSPYAPTVADVIRLALVPRAGGAFEVTITNLSTESTLSLPDGTCLPVPLSPGVWVVHEAPAPLFTSGAPDRGQGLERIAEDGNPSEFGAALAATSGPNVPISPGVYVLHSSSGPLFEPGTADRGQGLAAIAEDGNPELLLASLSADASLRVGAFDTPVGGTKGPARSGQAYEVTFEAHRGDRVSFATMWAASNDAFYAPGADGLALFDASGHPRSGDVTSEVTLWDVGSEANEEPGLGMYQPQAQPAPNSGPADPDDRVRPIDDGYRYAPVLRVTLRALP